MALKLKNFDQKTREAVMAFWGNRQKARQKQREAGKSDQGERAGVTAGKNMDGFIALVIDIIKANGLKHAAIYRNRALLTLPGFFRPTKLWDIVVIDKGELIAALEMKSHVGPSFGNNCNNRAEEAVGQGHDFWTAYREGAFGNQPQPFIGWMMLVEDAPKSRRAVKDKSPHFPVFPEFQGASYCKRYEVLSERLVKQRLYTSACVMTSSRRSVRSGVYGDMSDLTSFRTFMTSLAGHAASAAARIE